MRLHCGNCSSVVKIYERVFLDEMNTVFHQRCYGLRNVFEIIDRGTLREIIERYSFYDELRPHLRIIN